MAKHKDPITGYITCDEMNLTFYEDNFTFRFLCPDSYRDNRRKYIKPEQDGFLMGKTHQGYDIGIYLSKHQISPWGCHTIHTSSYILSESNVLESDMEGFWGIEFVGGTLNNLYNRDSDNIDLSNSGELTVKLIEDKVEYEFDYENEKWRIIIGSSSHFGSGVDGLHVENDGAYVRFEFQTYKKRIEAFKYLSLIEEMMSFMTGRDNVGVEKILLLKKKDEHGFMWSSSRLYVRTDEKLTERHLYNNIQFLDLGERLPNLIKILLRNTDKEPTYMLGFIAKNDRDAVMMTNAKIKEICSALECELTFIDDIGVEEEENLKELVQDVKRIIKEHRKGEKKLSSKTYDVINNSMQYWTMSASDKIIMLYRKYDDIMQVLHPNGIPLMDDQISKLIKYRNDITHGRHRIMNNEIATTAFALQGLVYCCILKRIGLSDDEIMTLSRDRKLLERFY